MAIIKNELPEYEKVLEAVVNTRALAKVLVEYPELFNEAQNILNRSSTINDLDSFDSSNEPGSDLGM